MDSKELPTGNTGSTSTTGVAATPATTTKPATTPTAGAVTNKLPELVAKSEAKAKKISKPYALDDREIKEFYGILLIRQMIRLGQKIDIVPDKSANRAALENIIGDLYMTSGGNLLDIEEDKAKGGHFYVVSKAGKKIPQKIKQLQYEFNVQFDAYRWVDINAADLKDRFALAQYRDCLFDASGKPLDDTAATAKWEAVIGQEQWRDHRLFVALKKGISPARLVFMTMLAEGFFDKYDFLTLGIEAFTGEVWTEMLARINNNIWPDDYLGLELNGKPIDEELINLAFEIIASEGAQAYIDYQKANAEYNGQLDEFEKAQAEAARLQAQQAANERKDFYGNEGTVTETVVTETVVEEVVEDDFYEPPLAVQLAVAAAYVANPYYCSPVWYDPFCPVYGPTVIIV